MPIWWLTSDIVYFDSELALTVKQFFMQKNNTILDKIVSHWLWTYYAKNFQPLIFKNYIYIWRAILFADCTIKKPTKLIILKTLLICHRMHRRG